MDVDDPLGRGDEKNEIFAALPAPRARDSRVAVGSGASLIEERVAFLRSGLEIDFVFPGRTRSREGVHRTIVRRGTASGRRAWTGRLRACGWLDAGNAAVDFGREGQVARHGV